MNFTFQYVSINTVICAEVVGFLFSLHSNMFLLIPLTLTHVLFLIQSLHSNMFLLIHNDGFRKRDTLCFTFQYVSINTECKGLKNLSMQGTPGIPRGYPE